MTKIIILDRDGVINHDSPAYIKSPDEWHPIEGSLEAIAELNRAGYQVVVVTNQSGVGRGYYDHDTLDRIHQKLMHALAKVGGHIEEIFYCPHLPDDLCECRKPKPGLFYQLQKKYSVDFAKSFYIGDSYTDMVVAEEVGCRPILVLSGNGQQTLENNPELCAIPHFENLATAVRAILNNEI